MSEDEKESLAHIRNIGISAHIDSGKTTLTERILFYTGRIKAIHEVRGKDGVGAKMDSMELEREKGITIQSAATFTRWKDTHINIIDTPGHVDFTIEVERALRVLDGAILVLCSVGGVQSQTITVDRQMRRYTVPRLAFINKCDRAGADPWRVIGQIREKLKHNCAAIQIPIGLEDQLSGVVDLVEMQAYVFEGPKGETVKTQPVPEHLVEDAAARRQDLIEAVAGVDDELMELFIGEEAIDTATLSAAIRRATLACKFFPVFMGSAYKNCGVQTLLDGVTAYLPSPTEVENTALDVANNEEPFVIPNSPSGPLAALAFKLEEGKYGQLTYVRVYSGTLRRGGTIVNVATGKKHKIPRLVRTHSDELEDVEEVQAGEICAIFGLECASGDTFTSGERIAMTSIKVPDPVVSLAIAPKTSDTANFFKALARFQREDPTFRVHTDPESNEVIISGMGELHLEVYTERIRREYGIDCHVGNPKVNYREAITQRVPFDYTHKKQTGGSGQYGKVEGYLEPMPVDGAEAVRYVFENRLVGTDIPGQLIPSVDKGFQDAMTSGSLTGHPVEGVRVVLEGGGSHPVDSSDIAFRLAAVGAFRQAFAKAAPVVLEPQMLVEVTAPVEYQGTIMGDLNRRRGMILDAVAQVEDTVITAMVPLSEMFGYSSALRSQTAGKGEYSMEYSKHAPVTADRQAELTGHYKRSKSA